MSVMCMCCKTRAAGLYVCASQGSFAGVFVCFIISVSLPSPGRRAVKEDVKSIK